jgi:putative transposase
MYYTTSHSKFNIKFHLIFVIKYRKKILIGDLNNSLKQLCLDISLHSDFSIDILETDKDHIHILVNSIPKLSPLMIVRKLKQETTIGLWKKHNTLLQKHFWKEHTFWSDGYFVCSTGDASTETIRKYI